MTWIDDRAFRGLKEFIAGVGPGDVIAGRFEIQQRIGEGGMAVVYAGLDRETSRDVAIKIIRGYGDHDDARFSREVMALQRALHPAIVEYVAHGAQDGERYVVMERLVGCSLAERLRLGPLSAGDVIVLGERIAGALAAVHAAGITHRDIKPSNVFLAAESVAQSRLVDFGLARPTYATTLTGKGALVGTPGYMAPEQVRGGRDVGPAADVFALGCVLWECVAGRPPFAAEDDEVLFERILLAQVPSLDAEHVPPVLVELVARMLEKDPSRRPGMREISDWFGELAAGAPRADAIAVASPPEVALGIREGEVVAGKYEVESLLGAGGMGVVVAARHLELGTRVALKLLRSGDVADRARFVREARAASQLESEHVARVLDVGSTADGRPYMVMEHLSGTDLACRLATEGPLSVETAVTYVLETCEAIAEAHALGVVHRDLKPSNLFVVRRRDGSEIIKVLDFGISKRMDPLGDASVITDAKVVMGSVPYMSPEQVHAAKQVDTRSDIWSLGIVLHELVTARRPFEGDNAPAVAARIAASEPMHLREVRVDAPAKLEEVILRCLEKEPARRYPTLAALARALAPFAPARAHVSVDRVTRLLGSPPDDAPPNELATLTPATRSRARVAPGVVVAVAIVAVSVWMWPPSRPTGQAPGRTSTTSSPSVSTSRAPMEVASESLPVEEKASLPPPPPPLVSASGPLPSSRPLTTAAGAAARPSAMPLDAGPSEAGRPRSSGELDLHDPRLESR